MKRVLLILLMAFMAGPAIAQPLQRYTLTLSVAEIEQIAQALEKQPFKDVHDLIALLQAQISQQNQAAAHAKAEADKDAVDKAVAEKLKSKQQEQQPKE